MGKGFAVRIVPFEHYARQYDDWFVRHKSIYEAELEAIRQLLPLSDNGVEIGVGSGRFAAPLDIKIGVEPSINMGKVARGRGIEVVQGVAEALPFRNCMFDYALLVTTICFVDDLELSLNESYRILKSGAYIIIAFIDMTSPVGQLYDKHKQSSEFYRVAVFRSIPEVISALQRIGFGGMVFSQAIFHPSGGQDKAATVKRGYGEGSFVVVRATKEEVW
ncbi:MAG: class I SAM-dependent methyltransferase [Dehalococcoidia bacterium]|nr:class I SAM-dependent methyltransferase [Dehalococcoidia bacterium]